MGASVRFVKSVKAIYKSVQLYVRSLGKFSDCFDSFVGVKQGEPLSPLLFILFFNELSEELTVKVDVFSFDNSIIEEFQNLFYYSPMTLYYLQIRYLSYSHCLIKCQFIVRNGILLLMLIRLR